MIFQIAGKRYFGIEKTFYYAIDLNASTAVEAKAFIKADGDHGSGGSKTNWKQGEARLPEGQIFDIMKVGFAYRKTDGSPVTPAMLGKLSLATMKVAIGENEIKEGTLLEFFDVPVVLHDDTIDTFGDISAKSFIPLLGADGERWERESLDFNVKVPATEADSQLICFVKGMLYKPASL